MAIFCPYEGRKCSDCPHCRYDEDYGDKACFLKQDLSKEEYEASQMKVCKIIFERRAKNKEEK